MSIGDIFKVGYLSCWCTFAKVHCTALHFCIASPLYCIALHCNAMAMQCNAMQCNAMAMQCMAIQCNCNAMHGMHFCTFCNGMQCNAMRLLICRYREEC